MNNPYRNLMEQKCLSEQAKQDFYSSLSCSDAKKVRRFPLKAAIVAACILLMIPITALAVENIFGISVVDTITGKMLNGRPGIGYEVNYPTATARPLSDFPEELQTLDGNKTVTFNSWQAAEAELGFTLVNNELFSSPHMIKSTAYNLRYDGIGERVHCFTRYNGKDGQLYRATVTAAYLYQGTAITLQSTVTCSHPAISKEQEYEMHWSGVLYESQDVAQISQEQYTAANGITATIVTAERNGNRPTQYEAAFFANGASYNITIHSYDAVRDAWTKDTLIRILEAFVF
ncbi:MAG: hypothetical protein IJN60_05370 [Oscillospiraceae bacterium]|nr:hypothetical protein [Oscillospiraceae bacterium]